MATTTKSMKGVFILTVFMLCILYGQDVRMIDSLHNLLEGKADSDRFP